MNAFPSPTSPTPDKRVNRDAIRSWHDTYSRLREKSEREDLVMFVNACFAATAQGEFYFDRQSGSISIDFLHRYVMANYRTVYARALAAGINHFNQAMILANLLRSGAPEDKDRRREEGDLIRRALTRLPANRVYALLSRLSSERINNRRTRAVIRDFLASRGDTSFDAVKYRKKLRRVARHAHLSLDSETGRFLFALEKQKQFSTPLFDSFRRARYSSAAIYDLPMTVAETFARGHGVPRDEFLRRIEPKMTAAEKLRLHNAASGVGAQLDIDLGRTPLTKLALFVLSLDRQQRIDRADEFQRAFEDAARRALVSKPLRLGRVAAVLDRSRSTWGTRERRRRPLAVALATHYLLRAASEHYQAFWTTSRGDANENVDRPFLFDSGGQSNLAAPLIDAFESRPDQIILVSDGYENDPPGGVQQLVATFRRKLEEDSRIEVIHANPVFDPEHFSPRQLGPSVLTVGLRDAEDLATMLGFARFAGGDATLAELEDYLAGLAEGFLS